MILTCYNADLKTVKDGTVQDTIMKPIQMD